MNDAIEVEINIVSSKRGKYRSETRKIKDEPQSSSDTKFDSIMKVMEKLVDKLSIVDKQVVRDNNEPQIRNPSFRQPRQQAPQQPQIMQRGQRPPDDQVRSPFQENLVEKEYVPENEEPI